MATVFIGQAEAQYFKHRNYEVVAGGTLNLWTVNRNEVEIRCLRGTIRLVYNEMVLYTAPEFTRDRVDYCWFRNRTRARYEEHVRKLASTTVGSGIARGIRPEFKFEPRLLRPQTTPNTT